MLMDAAAIAAVVPHTGAMCLLDGVISVTADAIECVARRPLRPDNPLLEEGRLHAMALLEYGAQAAAVHAALAAVGATGGDAGGESAQALDGGSANPCQLGREGARAAYLASVRDVAMACAWIEDGTTPLRVVARCVTAGAGGAVYLVDVDAAGTPCLSARVTLAQPR